MPDDTAPISPATTNAVGSTTDVVAGVGLALLANVPVALHGAPGTGKTSLIRSLADTFRWPMHTMTATIHDATDFAGLAYLSSNGTLDTRTMRASLQWAVGLAKEAMQHDGNGIVFFDDISYAPPTVQNALLQIVQERRVGDYQMPFGVRCAAALNPHDTASSMRALTAPLANRMVHILWAPDVESWVAGTMSGWRPTVPPLHEGWQQSLPATRAKVTTFIRSHPKLLHNEPAEPSAQGGPWPSRRTWDMLITLLGACDAANVNMEVRRLLAVGSVGESTADAYLAWVEQIKLAEKIAGS